jgi:hypothetical protein
MFTEFTTVPCTADKGDHEGADSMAVGLVSRIPDPCIFARWLGLGERMRSRHLQLRAPLRPRRSCTAVPPCHRLRGRAAEGVQWCHENAG